MLRQSELQTKTRIAGLQDMGKTVPEKLWEDLHGGEGSGKSKKDRDRKSRKDGGGGKEQDDDRSSRDRVDAKSHPRIDVSFKLKIMKMMKM